MKKFLASILLVLYVTASSGIVINLHYCMDRFDSMQLGVNKSEVCGKCGMHNDESNSCCHDEVKIIKLQDNQKISQLNYEFPAIKILNSHSSDFVTERILSLNGISFVNHPPPLSKQNSYLLNCVFRI